METAPRKWSDEWWRAGFGDPGSGVDADQSVPSDSRVPFWAFMGFTFVMLIAPQSFLPALAPFRLALVAAAIAVATHAFDRFIHDRPFTTVTRETWIVAYLVVWAFVMVPLSYWPGGSLSFLLNVYIKSVIVFWLLINTVTTLARLRQVVWGLTLMALPLAVTGVKNFASGTFAPLVVATPASAQRIVGYEAPLTKNPNDLALMLNFILPLAIALLLGTRKPAARALLITIICLLGAGVVVTYSRAGFLTLGTICVLYLWRLRKRTHGGWAWAIILLAVACLPLLPPGYLERLSTLTDIESDPTGSAQARWYDTVAAIRMVLASPLIGAGAGMNVLALNEARGALWTLIHNAYLEYAVDLGVAGLILFVLLLVACLDNARFVQQHTAAVPEFAEFFNLAEGIQISLMGFVVAAMFHPVGYLMHVYYMTGLAVAVRLAYAREIATHHA